MFVTNNSNYISRLFYVAMLPAQVKPKSFDSTQNIFLSFFTRDGCVSCLRACLGTRLLPQSYQYLSEGADRVGGQLRGHKECPFSGVTKSGRVWKKVPESDARSVLLTPTPFSDKVKRLRIPDGLKPGSTFPFLSVGTERWVLNAKASRQDGKHMPPLLHVCSPKRVNSCPDTHSTKIPSGVISTVVQ